MNSIRINSSYFRSAAESPPVSLASTTHEFFPFFSANSANSVSILPTTAPIVLGFARASHAAGSAPCSSSPASSSAFYSSSPSRSPLAMAVLYTTTTHCSAFSAFTASETICIRTFSLLGCGWAWSRLKSTYKSNHSPSVSRSPGVSTNGADNNKIPRFRYNCGESKAAGVVSKLESRKVAENGEFSSFLATSWQKST